jgi:hypothetical protein
MTGEHSPRDNKIIFIAFMGQNPWWAAISYCFYSPLLLSPNSGLFHYKEISAIGDLIPIEVRTQKWSFWQDNQPLHFTSSCVVRSHTNIFTSLQYFWIEISHPLLGEICEMRKVKSKTKHLLVPKFSTKFRSSMGRST